MIRAKVCFVAEGVSIDRETNLVSAFGLLETLHPDSYPLFLQRISFLCVWEREGTDPQRCRGEFSITLDGQDISRQSIDIDFLHHLRNKTTIRLNGFVVSQPGNIVFRLAIPGHDQAEYVVIAGPATPAARAPDTTGAWPSNPLYETGPVSVAFGHINFRPE